MKIYRTALLSLVAAQGALAATPQTSTVEFFHGGLQHYFVTADAVESLAVGNGSAGAGWVPTGRTFGVWSDASAAPATAVPVCRFYSTGSHAHFYTADAAECAQLRALQATQSPAAAAAQKPFTGWAYEGNAFYAQVPAVGKCPAATEAVYRFYSSGAQSGTGSSHRFVTDSAMAALMKSRGWTAEGVAFCSPVTATGTSAPADASTGAFPEIAATWTGTGPWKFAVLPDGTTSSINASITLTVSAHGALTGSGAGCALAGSLSVGDGFRSLYSGSVTTTACTDAHFTGVFPLTLERLGAGLLALQFGNATSTLSVEVEALLSSGNAPPPPPATSAATFTGTVAWIVNQSSGNAGGVDVTAVNLPLTLVLDGTTLSGTGAGCTFTGTLQNPLADAITATATAAGCANAAFNGTYAQVTLTRANGAALAIEFEKETQAGSITTNASIRGALIGDGGITIPLPPGPVTTAGTWTGDALWLVVQQQGGNETTLVSRTGSLSLTIASGGALTGSGFGCALSGSLQSIAAGLTGTVTATGCDNNAFNGSYNGIGIHVEGDDTLQIDLEREVAGGGTTLKITIAGVLPAGNGTVTPPPPPPASGFVLAGTWSSAQAQWTDARQQNGDTTTVASEHPLTLTIAAGGAVTGSGFGCLFTGNLQAVPGYPGVFFGTLAATGCTSADFNGNYDSFGASAEGGGMLDVEFERESEGGGLRISASVAGQMKRQ